MMLKMFYIPRMAAISAYLKFLRHFFSQSYSIENVYLFELHFKYEDKNADNTFSPLRDYTIFKNKIQI
jgi:hypothetical protein